MQDRRLNIGKRTPRMPAALWRASFLPSYLPTFHLPSSNRGFTAVEILVVVVIIGILVALSLASLPSLNQSQALNLEADNIKAMLERARLQSAVSENDIEHGIYFASSSATIFIGKFYPAGSSTNEVRNLHAKTKINSINLSNGSSSLYFNRLTGKPSATGTIALSLVSGASSTKTITIYNTGLSEVR